MEKRCTQLLKNTVTKENNLLECKSSIMLCFYEIKTSHVALAQTVFFFFFWHIHKCKSAHFAHLCHKLSGKEKCIRGEKNELVEEISSLTFLFQVDGRRDQKASVGVG